MALYKYAEILRQSTNSEFDAIYDPGARPPVSGIYRCEGCAREITHISGTALPPQNHHQHSYEQGRIRWRLIVAHEGER
jgi:hypothetical protein